MNDIPYVIKKYPMTELDKRDFHLELMKQSMTQPYELKQMLPVVSDGETESVYAVFTVNQNFDTYNSLTPNWYYKVLR